MATQKYRSQLDKTVGENRGSPTKVPGHGQVTFPKGGREQNAKPDRAGHYARSGTAKSWGRSSGAAGDNSGKQGYGGPRLSIRASGRDRRPSIRGQH